MKSFYCGKNVLITGHTGFKGSWMSYILYLMGAKVTGIALEPIHEPNLFSILKLDQKIDSRIVDIRNLDEVLKICNEIKPEIILHLAAQPLVLESYQHPVYTYDVNVMGTVNICECVRLCKSVKSFVNITTDKVYENKEWCYGYRESDRLNGYDPYSNSKSCSELISDSYTKSFFNALHKRVSTCRAGNVIGGGDFSENRILPDCAKYTITHHRINVRNPHSTRPYQHVLEPVLFYLNVAKKQYEDAQYAGSYNIGPDEKDCITTGEIVTLFCEIWGGEASWDAIDKNGPHEANFLRLDTSLAKTCFNWKPKWCVKEAVEHSIAWYKAYYEGIDVEVLMKSQIEKYIEGDMNE